MLPDLGQPKKCLFSSSCRAQKFLDETRRPMISLLSEILSTNIFYVWNKCAWDKP